MMMMIAIIMSRGVNDGDGDYEFMKPLVPLDRVSLLYHSWS